MAEYIYIYICVCVCVCVYKCMYVCIAWMVCKSLWIKVSAKCVNVNIYTHTHLHTQCMQKVFTALHSFQILFFLNILQTIPHNDKVKEVCCNVKKRKKSDVHKYSQPLPWHSELSSGAPVSTDHPWAVSITRLESTCGKFSWWDMI